MIFTYGWAELPLRNEHNFILGGTDSVKTSKKRVKEMLVVSTNSEECLSGDKVYAKRTFFETLYFS